MIVFSGRVVIEGSGSPVPGVAVELFEVSGLLHQGTALSPSNATAVTSQPSLGSSIANEAGEFRIELERDPSSPSLLIAVAVLAPEKPDVRTGKGVIHLVPRVRNLIDGEHQVVVAIPSVLRENLLSPPKISNTDRLTASALRARATELGTIKSDVGQIAAETRAKAANRSRGPRQKVIDDVSKALSERAVREFRRPDGTLPPTIVSPKELVRSRGAALVADALKNSANQTTVTALIDVTDKDAARVLDGGGDVLSTVSSSDIEALLFGAAHTEGLPARFWRDVISVGCRNLVPPYEHCGPNEAVVNDGTSSSGTNPPAEATLSDIKKAVAALIQATEEASLPFGSVPGRATAETIGKDISSLFLRDGPSNAIAQFDFERLFLASDLVVKHHQDQELVKGVTDMVIAIEALGGDLKPHQKLGLDTVDALAAEAALLASSDPLQPPQQLPKALMISFPNPLDHIRDLAGEAASALVGGSGGDSKGSSVRDHRDGSVRDHRDGEGGGNKTRGPRQRTENRFADVQAFLRRLREVRATDYGFTAFGTDESGPATSFGLLLTYRQQWRPEGHQVGELVKSIPLPPKASMKYSVRRKTASTYNDKRAEASESTYNREAHDVRRDVAKVVRNTKLETNFSLTNESGGGVPGAASTSTTSVWTVGAQRSSESTKEALREATRKQSEVLKRSISTEVSTSLTSEEEITEASEVMNPNEELVVTYLFYELQRRFEVTERLEKATPVVLVAQPLPSPSEIDEAWLIRNDWVIRRVLLDPDFAPAISYVVSGKLLADQGSVDELEAHLDRQDGIVADLQRQLVTLRSPYPLPDPRNILEQWKVSLYDEKYPGWRSDEQRVREVFGDDVAERIAARQQSLEQVESDLKREVAQLEQATDVYNRAFTTYVTEAVQVERLLLHIKENILFYQQALLDHENPDQRFLRLRNTVVPRVQGNITYTLANSGQPPRPPTWRSPLQVTVSANLRIDGDDPLERIADLTTPLGYVGNAIVFPVRTWNPLVTFLLAPFSNAVTGVSDPDDRHNVTLAEFKQLVCCLKDNLSESEFKKLKPRIDAAWKARSASPKPDSQHIVIPTDSLYVESLPGSRPLLEDFKLRHRALDVQQVSADLVLKRLEQLRLAARLIEDELDDPDTDKVIIRDSSPVVIDTGGEINS